MRRTFVKLVAMLMMLVLVLTGCGMVKEDPMKQIAKQREEIEKTYSAVVAEYDGGKITLFDVMAPFYSSYSYMEQIYSMFGMSLTEEDVVSMQQDAVETELINRAIAKEFEARGLTLDISDEDIKGEVNAMWDEGLSYYLENVGGDTDEIKKAAAELAMYGEGFTLERMLDMYRINYQGEMLQADIEAEIADITEEELQAAYESRLAADEEQYTGNPSYYESDMMNDVAAICWVPEGYRTVKHVLVIPEASVLQAVTDARDAFETAEIDLENLKIELENVGVEEPEESDETEVRTAEMIQADIDAKTAELPELESTVAAAEAACLDSVKEKTDAIYADLAAGKTIDEVMAAHGEDPGMQAEPYMTSGYYVCADSYTWDQNFTIGSMALEKVGDYSATPVISASGVHIIYYNSDVVSGPVALEDVREELYGEALAEVRNQHFQTVLAELVNAMNPVYHLENWTLGK